MATDTSTFAYRAGVTMLLGAIALLQALALPKSVDSALLQNVGFILWLGVTLVVVSLCFDWVKNVYATVARRKQEVTEP